MPTRRSLLAALGAAPLTTTSLSLPALAQAGAIVAPIRLEAGRVLIDAGINGRGPYPFAIDTGAVVSGIEEDIAKGLGLPVLRRVRLAGKVFDLYQARELTLGGAVRQADAVLFGLKGDLGGAQGLLAAGLVTTFDSTLDFDRSEWRVYPGGLPDRTGLEVLASSIRQDEGANGSRRIGVEVLLDGQKLSLVVDTGLPKTLVLETQVGKRLGYWGETRPFAPASSVGIAGPAPRPSRVFRGGALQIGGMTFDKPLVTVRDAPRMKQEYDGILGLPIIELMTLSVDTAKGALLARRNARARREERVSRTGLWVDEAPGGAKVSLVGKGGPAEAAGLKPGDRIKGPSFGAILRQLGADSGVIELEVEGRGKVSLTPAAYI